MGLCQHHITERSRKATCARQALRDLHISDGLLAKKINAAILGSKPRKRKINECETV